MSILEPSQAELFFCATPVFVEGAEDIAFIATQFALSKQWDEFRSLGCLLLPGGGKRPLLPLLAVAQGLELRPYIVFDLDSNKRGTKDEEGTAADNRALLQLLGETAPEPFSDDTVFGPNYAGWSKNIATAVREELGTEWEKAVAKTRKEQGLPSEDVPTKNRLLIASTLECLWDQGTRVRVLEEAVRARSSTLETGDGPSAAAAGSRMLRALQ